MIQVFYKANKVQEFIKHYGNMNALICDYLKTQIYFNIYFT